MRDVTVAGILHALSDPIRLAIVRVLVESRGGLNCIDTVHQIDVALPKSTLSQHYRILRESGLVISERVGVELSSRVRSKELEAKFPGLLKAILRSGARELATPVTLKVR